MCKALVLLSVLFTAIAGCGTLAEETQVQELGKACKGGDGISVTCHYSSVYDTCSDNSACGPDGGYCQETNTTEDTFCRNTLNCSNPNYHTYCTWGPLVGGCGGYVKDPSAYTHFCISGPRP